MRHTPVGVGNNANLNSIKSGIWFNWGRLCVQEEGG